jgi:heme-degrading monooxygenase HmoA
MVAGLGALGGCFNLDALNDDPNVGLCPVAGSLYDANRVVDVQGVERHENVGFTAFVQRPHLVDNAPGFIRLEVISPVDNRDEIWLLTYWLDEQSFKSWHHSHLYHDSHKGIPKGLKLVPKSVRLRFFEHISS